MELAGQAGEIGARAAGFAEGSGWKEQIGRNPGIGGDDILVKDEWLPFLRGRYIFTDQIQHLGWLETAPGCEWLARVKFPTR